MRDSYLASWDTLGRGAFYSKGRRCGDPIGDRGFPAPVHGRSTVGAYCENDAASESAPPPTPSESVPAMESSVAWRGWHVCDSPPVARVVLVGASAAACPAVRRVARLARASPLRESSPATGGDGACSKHPDRHRGWPSCDIGL